MTRTLVAGRLVILAMFAVAVLVAALALAGCSSSGPSVAGCKKAMEHNYAYAMAHPDAKPATEPAACKGLSRATLDRLAGQVANEAFNGTLPKS